MTVCPDGQRGKFSERVSIPRWVSKGNNNGQSALSDTSWETQEAASLSFPSLGLALANLLSGSLEGTTSYLWHKPPCPCFSGLVWLEGRKLVAALCGKRHLLGPSASSTWSCSPRESVVGLDWQREASEHILKVPSFLNIPLISFSSLDPISVASLRHEFQYIHPSPLEVSYLMELAQLTGLWDSLQPTQWPHTSDFP